MDHQTVLNVARVVITVCNNGTFAIEMLLLSVFDIITNY